MSYATLTVGQGFLKNLDPLVTNAQHGLTAADVAKAEAAADAQVNAWFARHYDVASPSFATAPMVAQIAERLGSALLLAYKFSRDGTGNVNLIGALKLEAREMKDRVIADGLVSATGAILARRHGNAPRVGNPAAAERRASPGRAPWSEPS
ncbi:MAG TPA: hypothetical protein PKZ08_00585 [Vicinamibacterales bacterium]|nr:hypothetical protein [Vicinamibacterales bacterium]